jgi:hypothetical protein
MEDFAMDAIMTLEAEQPTRPVVNKGKALAGERAWVETVKTDIEAALARQGITVQTGYRLPYAVQIASYRNSDGSAVPAPVTRSHGYQTDMLIAEQIEGTEDWVPRVVVEFKLGDVTTHDALTYSAKAATHKSVHPYLRYGIVIGAYKGQVPLRLIRHGLHLDFMVTLASKELTATDRDRLAGVLRDEILASQTMSAMLAAKSNIWLVHKKLEVRSEG